MQNYQAKCDSKTRVFLSQLSNAKLLTPPQANDFLAADQICVCLK